jgi:hypothetical protein
MLQGQHLDHATPTWQLTLWTFDINVSFLELAWLLFLCSWNHGCHVTLVLSCTCRRMVVMKSRKPVAATSTSRAERYQGARGGPLWRMRRQNCWSCWRWVLWWRARWVQGPRAWYLLQVSFNFARCGHAIWSDHEALHHTLFRYKRKVLHHACYNPQFQNVDSW